MILSGWVTYPNGLADRRDSALAEDIWRELQGREVDVVVIAGHLNEPLFHAVVEASSAAGCRTLFYPIVNGTGELKPSVSWHKSTPFIELGLPGLTLRHLLLKRLMDVVGASLLLIVLSPLFLLVALVIKLDSRGPVFFVQERVGLGGRVFRLVKFRSMRNGSDLEKATLAHLNRTGDPRLFKIPNDPRVTRVGAWLRRWSADELPQLWNVLKGDMSLVGPRPFPVSDVAGYQDHHFLRLTMRPGITGLWQVEGRSDIVDFEEVARLDRQYVERWSPWLDLAIMARTLPAVLRRKGAY
jgi:exopolysaccharide biosynthesis polyprenyl glycosylphosphotransferase